MNKVLLCNYSYCHIDKIEFFENNEELYDIDVEDDHSFLLEGGYVVHNSAGGSAKQGRNNRFQAILPLRGKVINVEKTSMSKALLNKEFQSLVSALNISPKPNGQVADIDDLRFHNIILLADADPDGAHITCLLITFFYKFMRTIIEHGHLKVAQPPLYRIKDNKKIIYIKDDEELDEFKKKNSNKNIDIQRFKGLGEMNPEQLAEAVLDPKHRILLQINVDDAAECTKTIEQLFSKDVEGRKKFLEKDLDLTIPTN